jgi:hypothetical protein
MHYRIKKFVDKNKPKSFENTLKGKVHPITCQGGKEGE